MFFVRGFHLPSEGGLGCVPSKERARKFVLGCGWSFLGWPDGGGVIFFIYFWCWCCFCGRGRCCRVSRVQRACCFPSRVAVATNVSLRPKLVDFLAVCQMRGRARENDAAIAGGRQHYCCCLHCCYYRRCCCCCCCCCANPYGDTCLTLSGLCVQFSPIHACRNAYPSPHIHTRA